MATPIAVVLLLALQIAGCTPNDPYRPSEREANIYYTTFSEPPKHFDPARAYSSDEYNFIGQIYEPLVQYHYMKRPYELTPLSARKVPAPNYYDKHWKRLPQSVSPSRVYRAVYDIRLKEGVKYQPHPAFATDSGGKALYSAPTDEELKGIDEIRDFPHQGTRTMKSDDFIYQIKRLADPRVQSPILSILEKYILGLSELKEALNKELTEIRARRKKEHGAAYNRSLDEKENPIILDYGKHSLPGARKVDDLRFKIILKSKYPQFVYWLAMPFFSPMPEEAVRFYRSPALTKKNITLDRFPVGTGPFMIGSFDPNLEITLERNPNFHGEAYPEEGDGADRKAGLLEDAGRPLPFLDKVVFKLEKESIPRWSKFLQGYYDASGITSDSFDSAVTLSAEGGAELTELMVEKSIRLITSVRPSIYYMGFNMLDDAVGGYSSKKQKLRQAISIVLDYEEYIEIFNNGRGIAAMGPLPPGIFGFTEGRGGVNPYVYDYDKTLKKPVRKSLKKAKKLMVEAGYPGGRDRQGRPLSITFDNPWTGVDAQALISWYVKKFKLLGIQLENRTTDYNRFREKVMKGNFQLLGWGWNADYPDPENFFFLLAGGNGKVRFQGENAANYANPAFDRLFKKMENMDSGPERLKIIGKMTRTAQKDAPWVFGYHPVSFSLQHEWVGNVKSNSMANNTMKYIKIDVAKRGLQRELWNRPKLWPVAAVGAVLLLAAIPAILRVRRKMTG